jgi:hypothetical protein
LNPRTVCAVSGFRDVLETADLQVVSAPCASAFASTSDPCRLADSSPANAVSRPFDGRARFREPFLNLRETDLAFVCFTTETFGRFSCCRGSEASSYSRFVFSRRYRVRLGLRRRIRGNY